MRFTLTTIRTHDIPVEIFNEVLSHLRDVDPPLQTLQHDKVHLGWLNVTFVSQSWRTATLSNRSLWTRIPLNLGTTWPRVFIERSHPLPVDVDLGNRSSPYWMDLLLRNFHRIRTLQVGHARVDQLQDPLYALIEQPSEALETLVIPRLWEELEFPRIRPHQYPRLRKLHLKFSAMRAEDFPWRDMGNTALVELKVTLKHPRHNDSCVDDIVYALKKLPSLITFEMVLWQLDDRESDSQADHGVAQSTYLSSLENLTLEADGEMITRILGLVSFSTLVKTTLIPIPTGPMKRTSLYASLIPWIAARSKGEPPSRLAFTIGGHQRIQINAARSTKAERGVHLSLDIDRVIHDAFPDILYNLGPDSIRVINVAILTPLSLSGNHLLTQVSSICHNITHITISSGHHSNEAAGALAIILRRLLLPARNTVAHPPFLSLVALNLTLLNKEIVSARCTHSEDVQPYRIMPLTLADSLVKTLDERRDAGGVMPRVYMSEWMGPMTRFEEGVLGVVRTIPGVYILPAGSRVPLDGVLG